MGYQNWVIANIENLSYEYDCYCLDCGEANKNPMTFKEYCTVCFNARAKSSELVNA